MIAHTPGPWSQSHRQNKRGSYSTEVYDAAGEVIATLAWYPVKTEHGIGTNREANARLMAAAPDMLAALQNIENDGKQVPDHAWALIQAAIAKATGAA